MGACLGRAHVIVVNAMAVRTSSLLGWYNTLLRVSEILKILFMIMVDNAVYDYSKSYYRYRILCYQ